AVEDRQGPETDRMPVEPKGDRVAGGVEIGAAVVVDDALRVAGGAGGVVERDRAPFVLRRRPGRRRIALGEKRLVLGAAERGAIVAVSDLDERDGAAQLAQRLAREPAEFAIDDQELGRTVAEDEPDRAGIEPVIE